MGADDDVDCVEHVWQLDELHLSVARGVEAGQRCTRCGAACYAADTARGTRPPLRPA